MRCWHGKLPIKSRLYNDADKGKAIQIGIDFWTKCKDHVIREEDLYWKNDRLGIVQHGMEIDIHDTSRFESELR